MRNLGRWLSGCGLVLLGWFLAQAVPAMGADPQTGKAAPTPTVDKNEVVAVVNGQPISRQDLGEELIARFGKEQLQLFINRRIIDQAAKEKGIIVTEQEVKDDIRDVMRLGQFQSEKEFETHFLKKEKNCTLFEYKEDVVRPALIMRKLAGQRLNVSEEEIKQAFDFKYGDKVQCRIIFEQNKRIADGIYRDILLSTRGISQGFLEAARRQSNAQLAANAGMIPPLGHTGSNDIIEQRAFSLRDGEMSEVLAGPGGHVIVYRENAVPADDKHTLDKERDALRVELMDKKMRAEVPKIFKELKDKAKVDDFLNQKHSDGLIGAVEQLRKENGATKNQ
jgi:hypothetical protein